MLLLECGELVGDVVQLGITHSALFTVLVGLLLLRLLRRRRRLLLLLLRRRLPFPPPGPGRRRRGRAGRRVGEDKATL